MDCCLQIATAQAYIMTNSMDDGDDAKVEMLVTVVTSSFSLWGPFIFTKLETLGTYVWFKL